MEALATYLIKSSVWLTGFALVYALFLRNERFFTLNRIYLVSGILVSMVFPLFTWHYTVLLALVPNVEVSDPQVQQITVAPEESFNPQNLLLLAYLAGILYLVFRILQQTLPVFRIIRKSETRQYSSAKLIRTAEYPASFSFFSFVFVNPSISDTETNEIVNHELEHIRQQHWIDLLLFEILRTVQWFNPAIWLYGHLIRQNHEYLADERALQRTANPAVYRAALLNQMFGGPVITLANSFNYSLNKKRFTMMKQTISSPLRKLKLLLVLPLIAGVFYAFATPEYKFIQTENSNVVQESRTVTGKVISEDGKPLKGASVIISGTTIGTITDASGNFKLILTDASPIVISFVGFESQKINPDFSKEVVIPMKRKTISLFDDQASETRQKEQIDINKSDALFIVDSIEIPRAELAKIHPDKIERIEVLKNKTSIEKYGEKGKNGVVLITLKKGQSIKPNGTTEFENKSNPLYVLDGINMENFNIKDIPPETIESIEVLKGESAAILYGGKGKNGVIVIKTKKGATATNNATNDIKLNGTSGTESKPLFLIDGIISENQDMSKIDPETIESVNVLKNESAASKYGEKGKNGVLEIKLKPNAPYIMVEKMPEFPGGLEALRSYIKTNLIYPKDAMEKGIEGQVLVSFTVDKNGAIKNLKSKQNGVDPSLINAAFILVKEMPNWNPGKQNGENVEVAYTLPVNFQLQDNNSTNGKLEKANNSVDKTFIIVEEQATFLGGDVNSFRDWVIKNIKYPTVAAKKGISGKVYVQYAINSNGEVEDVKVVRGVDPSLDKEAVRVIMSSPLWEPAKQGGIKVKQQFTIPVNFNLPAYQLNK